jgi:hypothetical protein
MLTRRANRYVVMPLPSGHLDPMQRALSLAEQRRYGIVDVVAMDKFPGESKAHWCRLPGEDGKLKLLSFPTLKEAAYFVRLCGDIRKAMGGPIFLLPPSYYAPDYSARTAARHNTDPWEWVPAQAHQHAWSNLHLPVL